MDKSWSTALGPVEPGPVAVARKAVAQALRASARRLIAWASLWQPPEPAAQATPQWLEFHAEAGAPEGALYVNGQRVGVVPGVTRL